ncbi:MAG: hypothetical protein Tsb0020_10690 [Haliangiales bacterium]
MNYLAPASSVVLPTPAAPLAGAVEWFCPTRSETVATLSDGSVVWRLSGQSRRFASDVIPLRAAVYGQPAEACGDEYDERGAHYVLYRDDEPVYALRINHASAGGIEGAACYPDWLMERYGHALVEGCRFVGNPAAHHRPTLAREFLAACWADCVARGVRVKIGNVIGKLLPYYHQHGFRLVRAPVFVHPKWGTKSYVVALFANAALAAGVGARLPEIPDPVSMSEIDSISTPIKIRSYA